MKPMLLERLTLHGLSLAPSQAWQGIRLVPVIRIKPPGDLRLAKRSYAEPTTVAEIDGRPRDDSMLSGAKYTAYVPHGLVVSWSDNGDPIAVFGANMVNSAARDGRRYGTSTRIVHRMVKREDKNRLRLLPLHLAMEGFLALYFGGPDVAWHEYSRYALSRGLSPRSESVLPGRLIMGLEDALRVFEIHEHQVGVLIFVGDAFASAFIVSHHDDYRSLHRSLLEDFYGDLMYHYGLHGAAGLMEVALDTSDVSSLDDLEQAVDKARTEWAAFHEYMASGIFHRPLTAKAMYRCGPFQLQRFSTDLTKKSPASTESENHIGEAIVRADGTIEYLKTYRLSAAQSRRAFLLNHIAAQNWNIDATAAALGQSKNELIRRLENAGFGYLLKQDVVAAARRSVRGRHRRRR